MSYRKDIAPELSIGHASAKPGPVERAIRTIAAWADNELKKVESALRVPELRGAQFETLQELPERYKEGDLYYFAPGVAGGAAGLYIRDGNSWRRL